MTESRTRRAFLAQSARHSAGGAALLSAASAAATETPAEVRVVAQFTSGLKRPRKVAVDGPMIHVAGDCEIRSFTRNGGLQASLPLPRPARCLAVAGDGQLLAGMLRTVVRLDARGRELARWSLDEGAVLSSLAVAGDEILAADAGSGEIWRWDRDGQLLAKITRKARFAAPVEFFHVVAAAGAVHVNNPGRHRIESFTADGQHLRQWGAKSRELAGFSGCCNPVSFAVLSSGEFVTAERGVPRLKRFDREGRFRALLRGPEQFTENARRSSGDQRLDCHAGGLDVAVDSDDRLVVLDRVTGRVEVLEV